MALRDQYDFGNLVNEAERIVQEELERQLESRKDASICLCEDCILDMAAFALNAVKPIYRISLLGTMYAHAADQGEYEASVRSAVAAAIDRVHGNPSHD